MQALEQAGEHAAAHAAYREALAASGAGGDEEQGTPLSDPDEAACRAGLARTAILRGDSALGRELAAAADDPELALQCAALLEAAGQPQVREVCCGALTVSLNVRTELRSYAASSAH